eukprot:CAMPEP_0179188336 /NCGR_PEP_ID=MMETSP0796-20121207/93472_1 /TAXON_ID=73915 /ORGANISM="Pyrodinium bahamense, Strain pbaha01" /LENGTH=296 /DNA_ID=CAMNT_0020892433 /DNA_START=211 /DNA_END=1103 /DNA_ORIENTATION=+
MAQQADGSGALAALFLVDGIPDLNLISLHEILVVRPVLGPCAVGIDNAAHAVRLSANGRLSGPLPLVLIQVDEGADACDVRFPMVLKLEAQGQAVRPLNRVHELCSVDPYASEYAQCLGICPGIFRWKGLFGSEYLEIFDEADRDLQALLPVEPDAEALVRVPQEVPDACQVQHASVEVWTDVRGGPHFQRLVDVAWLEAQHRVIVIAPPPLPVGVGWLGLQLIPCVGKALRYRLFGCRPGALLQQSCLIRVALPLGQSLAADSAVTKAAMETRAASCTKDAMAGGLYECLVKQKV